MIYVKDAENQIEISAELPGVKKDDIHITKSGEYRPSFMATEVWVMDLEKIRQQLEQDKQELLTRLEKIEADVEHGRSRDWEEQAQERENDEVLEGLSIEATAQLKRINNTLAKIKDNEYGYCQRCQQAINPSRLEVLPTAEYCLKCAE